MNVEGINLCPHCGQSIDPGIIFCTNCGRHIEAAPPTNPAAPIAPMPPGGVIPQAKGGIPGWVLIGCAALVIIGTLAVILVLVLARRGNLTFLRRPTPEPPTLPTPAFPLAWQDNFSTPEGGWGETSDLQSVKKYENGQYHISVNASELFIWSTAGQDLADFMVEIEATQVSGPNDNGYGLLFRFQDDQHFYRFDISGDGFYLLSKRSEYQWVTLVDWTAAPVIHKGQATNRLKVICQGSQISLYVNDRHLTDISDVSYSHGDIGLFAGTLSQGGVHISFDNLKVWAPEGAAVTPSPSVIEVTPTLEPPAAVDPSQLIAQGDELILESKFEEAIGAYEQATQAEPTNAQAYARWARALYLDYQFNKAMAKAQVASELDPTNAEAFAQLARSYNWNGQFDQALEAAREAVDLDPKHADARAFLAEVYLDLDRLDEAVSEAQMAVQLDDQSAEAHRSLGLVYFFKEQLPQALSELEKAAQLEPNLWLRQHELASVRRRSEAYVEAIIAYQRAIELRPHAQSYAGLGACYYELGQYEQALPNLQQSLSLDPDYEDAYALMGWVYARLDQCDQAVPMFQQALSLNPDLEEAQEGLSECQVAMVTSTPGPPPTPVVIVATATPLPATPTPAETPTPIPTPTAALTGKIAFTLWNGVKYDVWVAKVDGSGRTGIIGEMRQPAFSPDGSKIAVNGEAHYHMNLHVANADGSNLIEVSEHLEDSRPSWAPDGYHIVFDSTMHGDKRSRIYIIDDVTKRTEGHVLRNTGGDTFGRDPSWLPDGRIVYRGCDYWATGANCGLYSVPPDGSAIPTRLTTDGSDMAPAAYGNKVAFMSLRDGNWEIYSINTDGSDLKRLTNNGVNDGLPTFSPNGQFIAFVSDEGGKWAIWAMNADGSGRRKLFDLNGGYGSGEEYDWTTERISWAP
ncbi:MAG: tetratricopeptide repeat protein [Anaerolineae bacterium]